MLAAGQPFRLGILADLSAPPKVANTRQLPLVCSRGRRTRPLSDDTLKRRVPARIPGRRWTLRSHSPRLWHSYRTQKTVGWKQLQSQLLQAEHNLEIETKRRKEVEGLLEAERLQQAGDLSGAREEAKHVQEQTQRILDQVAWQGDACRLQLAQEQIKAQTCEELSNALAKEVSAYKRQLEELKAKCELLQSATSRLRLHQVGLREHKLQRVQMDERQTLLFRTCTRWKTEYLNTRRCVQSARILTAICVQRHKLSRQETINPFSPCWYLRCRFHTPRRD